MQNDMLYYYTSNVVYESWKEKGKIWATRSTSSNDVEDTIHIRKLFQDIYSRIDWDNNIERLEKAKCQLEFSRKISLKYYKDLLYYFMSKHQDEFEEIITNSDERNEYVYFGNEYKLFKADDWTNNCGSFHKNHFKSPTYNQWIFVKLLNRLSETEKNYFLNVNKGGTELENICLEKLPLMHFPFVICFSKSMDDRFFWDTYTGNEGVAFEFSKKELNSYLEEISSKYEYPIKLVDVVYDINEQKEEILDLIDDEGELLYTSEEKICINAAKYKHPYWKNEKEIRAIFTQRYFDDEYEIQENYRTKYKSGIVTQDYIEIPFPPKLVKRIFIGPQNRTMRKRMERESHEIKIPFELSEGYDISRI